MKKHIANIVTGCRIICSLPILFIPFPSKWFYAFYLVCGFTDIIDGVIARKTKTDGKFGATLDTVADFVFMLACVIKILPLIDISAWLWLGISVVFIIKICNIILSFARAKKLVSAHTLLNKITGFALFLLPFTLSVVEPTYSIAILCGFATVAAIQETYYTVKGQDIL